MTDATVFQDYPLFFEFTGLASADLPTSATIEFTVPDGSGGTLYLQSDKTTVSATPYAHPTSATSPGNFAFTPFTIPSSFADAGGPVTRIWRFAGPLPSYPPSWTEFYVTYNDEDDVAAVASNPDVEFDGFEPAT